MNWDTARPTNRPPEDPNRNWNTRWVELRPHPEQLRLWNDWTRFKIVPSGRRSGKTELAKRRLVEHLFRKTRHGQPGRYFAAAPTRAQAKRIFWDDLCALVPAEWKASVSQTDLRITTTRGAQLWVLGLDVPQRAEGTPWDGCVVDEMANCKPGIWDAHLRPALADRHGWAWLIGVPDMESPAQVEYESMVLRASSGLDPEWGCFRWSSADILPAEEIESARARLDPRLFEQEYLGKFVIAAGRAFADFDPAIHVKRAVYDPNLPICWSLDFNIDPMCSGVIQHHAEKIWVIDELSLPDTSTDSACDVFLERSAAAGWNLRNICLYGDATGHARDSTSGTTDWQIIFNRLQAFQPINRVLRKNPKIKDTANAVRAALRSSDKNTRLTIDPRCVNLINDLRNALCKDDLNDQHALAWLRYFIYREYPVRAIQQIRTNAVGFSII